MHIAVILLNWNGKKDTLECLCSLKNLEYEHYTVIIADNGSTDGSLQAISFLYPNVTVIDNKKNLGFAEGNNRAISYALDRGFGALLLLNNDTVVDPLLLKAFMATLQEHPKAILGAKVYLYSQKETFDHFGGCWNLYKGQFDLVGHRKQEDHSSWETPFEIDYVCGCALFARAEAFREIGMLDARFFLFWEESDFCFRAKKLGYTILVSPQAKIWHKVSASFIGGKAHTTYFWWRNRFLWIEKNLSPKEKWGVYSKALLPEIFKLIRHHLIRSLEYPFLKILKSSKCPEKKKKLHLSKAALCGVRDYILRHFYEGSSWIFTQKK